MDERFVRRGSGSGVTHYFSMDAVRRLIEGEAKLARRTAFIIANDTGARVGEMLKISAEHFDYDKLQMLLWDSKKKAWKIVPLMETSITAVKLYLDATKITGRLFPVTEKTLNNWLRAACRRGSIVADTGRRIRWHSWRGTFVRHNQDKGDKWLMQVTGDNISTLLKYYEDMTEDDLGRVKRGEVV